MSHYLKLTLMETRPEEMFDTAMSVIDWYREPEHIREILGKNIYDAPSILCDGLVKAKEGATLIELADYEWLYHAFNFRFVYYKDMNLLGLIGDLPKGFTIPGERNAAAFEFQDSSDCDYPLCSWLDLPVLEPIVRSVCDLGKREDYEKADKIYEKEQDEEGYFLRSHIYDFVSKKLHIWEILYSDHTVPSRNEGYRVFALNAIDSEERRFQIKNIFMQILRETKADMGFETEEEEQERE